MRASLAAPPGWTSAPPRNRSLPTPQRHRLNTPALKIWSGTIPQRFRALKALSEDAGSVPRTHSSQIPRTLAPDLLPLLVSMGNHMHTPPRRHTCIHLIKNKNRSFKKYTLGRRGRGRWCNYISIRFFLPERQTDRQIISLQLCECALHSISDFSFGWLGKLNWKHLCKYSKR